MSCIYNSDGITIRMEKDHELWVKAEQEYFRQQKAGVKMVYGYQINNGNIEYLGASDEQERLIKALEMANIDTTDIKFTDVEPVMAGGKYYLSVDDEAYKKAKAEEEAEQERQAMLPTFEEKIEAQVMFTAVMTDTLLEEE